MNISDCSRVNSLINVCLKWSKRDKIIRKKSIEFMKYEISSSHRHFYENNGLLEIEDLVQAAQLEAINRQIDKILSKRGKARFFDHDLWRECEEMRKFVCQRRFSEIAIQLTGGRSLVLGYDQLLSGSSPLPELHLANLRDFSAYQGVKCGLVVCLQGKLETTEESLSLFPFQPGNVVFFTPEIELDLSPIKEAAGHRYLLITYCDPNSLYVYNDKDPFAHFPKAFGYVFGDRLLEKSHPIVYRQ